MFCVEHAETGITLSQEQYEEEGEEEEEDEEEEEEEFFQSRSLLNYTVKTMGKNSVNTANNSRIGGHLAEMS